MKILADENMDAGIIAWLRAAGVDVLSIFESMRGCTDDEVLARANAEGRVILTKDLDFGEMIFSHRLPAVGVILIRMQGARSASMLAVVQKQWNQIVRHAQGNFLVVTQERIRVRALLHRSTTG